MASWRARPSHFWATLDPRLRPLRTPKGSTNSPCLVFFFLFSFFFIVLFHFFVIVVYSTSSASARTIPYAFGDGEIIRTFPPREFSLEDRKPLQPRFPVDALDCSLLPYFRVRPSPSPRSFTRCFLASTSHPQATDTPGNQTRAPPHPRHTLAAEPPRGFEETINLKPRSDRITALYHYELRLRRRRRRLTPAIR